MRVFDLPYTKVAVTALRRDMLSDAIASSHLDAFERFVQGLDAESDPYAALAMLLLAARFGRFAGKASSLSLSSPLMPLMCLPQRSELGMPALFHPDDLALAPESVRTLVAEQRSRIDAAFFAIQSFLRLQGGAVPGTGGVLSLNALTYADVELALMQATSLGAQVEHRLTFVPGYSWARRRPGVWANLNYSMAHPAAGTTGATVCLRIGSYLAGEEVFIPSARRSSAQLLAWFGVAPSERNADSEAVLVPLPELSPDGPRFAPFPHKRKLLRHLLGELAPQGELVLRGLHLSEGIMRMCRLACLPDDIDETLGPVSFKSLRPALLSSANERCAVDMLRTAVLGVLQRMTKPAAEVSVMWERAQARLAGTPGAAVRLRHVRMLLAVYALERGLVERNVALLGERAALVAETDAPLDNRHVSFVPLPGAPAALGAVEVRNLNISISLDANVTAVLQGALRAHRLVLLRNQIWASTDDQVRLSRIFSTGAVEEFYDALLKQVSPVLRVANRAEFGSTDVGLYWHCDGSMRDVPSDMSMWAIATPPETGGETLFLDLYQAYEALSPAERVWLGALHTLHADGKTRPLISAHPFTGRPCIHVNIAGLTIGFVRHSNRTAAELERAVPQSVLSGQLVLDEWLETAEREAVFAALDRVMNAEVHAYRHKWRLGDIVFAENHSVAHHATFCDARSVRVLHRTSVNGTHEYGLKTIDFVDGSISSERADVHGGTLSQQDVSKRVRRTAPDDM